MNDELRCCLSLLAIFLGAMCFIGATPAVGAVLVYPVWMIIPGVIFIGSGLAGLMSWHKGQ